MYRVRRKGGWRKRWPFKKWIKPKLDERFCPECELPYQNGPLPRETAQFCSGNVAAVLLPEGGWRKGTAIRLGRWKPSAGRFFLSEFIPAKELSDLETVIAQVREYLDLEDDEVRPGSTVRQVQLRPNGGRNRSRSLKTSPHK